MVNNYYIGDIHHNKTIKKDAYTEKLVLYSDDKYNYLDLINDINYTTDNNKFLEKFIEKVDWYYRENEYYFKCRRRELLS